MLPSPSSIAAVLDLMDPERVERRKRDQRLLGYFQYDLRERQIRSMMAPKVENPAGAACDEIILKAISQ